MSAAKLPRILVAEDQALLADIITEALAGHHEVLCAYNVADAAEFLLGRAVGLVLLGLRIAWRYDVASHARG